MSTISSGTTLTTALVQTGDTTGNLVIKTGSSNTTAMTISGSDQSVTLVGSLTANTNASTITTGTVPTARLATGTANSSTYLRGDQTWAAIASSQWTTSGSNIYYNTGNVGIGTSSPATQLDIKSAAFTDNELTLDNTSSNTTSRVLFKAAGTEYARVAGDSTQLTLQSGNIPTVFRVNSAERMRIDTSGNVGIGTSSPATIGTGYGTVDVRGSTGGGYRWGNSTDSAYTYSDSTSTVFATATSKPMTFGTNNTERMRIDTSGNLQFNSGYGSVATAYGCRAWVNFNPSSGGAVRASGGVSSVTDNGSANYTINLSFTMPDTNYAAAGMVRNNDNNNDTCVVQTQSSGTKSTTAFQVKPIENGGGFTASPEVNVMIFR